LVQVPDIKRFDVEHYGTGRDRFWPLWVRARRQAARLKHTLKFGVFKAQGAFRHKPTFECPICGYVGPFMDKQASTGTRKHAECPRCGALERHRLQSLVIKNVLQDRDPSSMKMLHFAPEPFFEQFRAGQFGDYATADLNMEQVDHRVDMRNLPFDDHSFDFVLASIVFDYIPDDWIAIKEVHRILRSGGIAILPVSLVADKTVEYSAPNPYESGHVRACGVDYFDRFEKVFARVDRVSSHQFPEKYQVFIYEDRSVWPNARCPNRPTALGEKHADIVPVCYA
jgi:hypothetical protein